MIRVERHDGSEIPVFEDALVLEEATTYTVLPRAPGVTRVRFGEVDLERSGRGFRLPVGHWVGTTVLLVVAATEERALSVEVIPRPEKLAQESWSVMIEELDTWVAGITVGHEGGREGAVGLSGAPVGVLVEALSPLVPELVAAVKAIGEMPRERMFARQRTLPAHAIRRVDSSVTRWLARNPDCAAEVIGDEETGRTEEPWLPLIRTESDLDHPANAYVAWGLWRIERVQETVADLLERAARRPGQDEQRPWCLARALQLRGDAGRLRRLRKQGFLREVRPAPSEAALLSVLDDPAYARVHRLIRQFLGARYSRGDGLDGLPAPVRPSYELYELWVFLAVVRAMQGELPSWDLSWHLREEAGALAGFGCGSTAQFVADGGDRLTLHFNQTFRNVLVEPDADRVGLTGERRPDLVINYRPEDGPSRWLAIDAKYRVGRAHLSDAFASCHIYRDALRWRSHGGSCVACLLAAPSKTDDTGPWFEPAFWEQHGFGAVALAPGDGEEGVSPLAGWILGMLRPVEDDRAERLVDDHAARLLEMLPGAEIARTPNAVEIAWGGVEGVVLLLTAEAVEIRLPTVEWTTGAYAPAASSRFHQRIDWGEAEIPEIERAIQAAVDARRAESRPCRYCGETFAPEHRHSHDVCHGCASDHEGVVY